MLVSPIDRLFVPHGREITKGGGGHHGGLNDEAQSIGSENLVNVCTDRTNPNNCHNGMNFMFVSYLSPS